MDANIEKGEIWRFTGLPTPHHWAGMEDLTAGDLLIVTDQAHFNNMAVSVVSGMIADGTFVKVAEADGTPVKEPEAPGDWVEKERLRLDLDDLPETFDEDCKLRLQIDTVDGVYVAIKVGSGGEFPLELIGGDLGKGDLDKVIIGLLYVRDHLKKAGYDF